MKLKIQYYKLDENDEYVPIKEGTEVKTKKEAKPIITTLFQVFSVKPDAIIEINDDMFRWKDFENKVVTHTLGDNVEEVTFEEAKKIAMRVKK